MKRMFLTALVTLFALPSFLLAANSGTTGEYKTAIWRSSSTGPGQLFFSKFASGPIVIGGIIVSSPAINGGGADNNYVQIVKSTNSSFLGFDATNATSAFRGTNSTVLSPIPSGHRTDYGTVTPVVNSTTTWSYLDKRGGAYVTILWDWLESFLSNPTDSLP